MVTSYKSWAGQAGNTDLAPGDQGAIDMYVSGLNGDDTYDGISAATPMATVEEALRRLTGYDSIRKPVRIHVGRNTADAAYAIIDMVYPSLNGPRGSIVIIGDGAGQAGEDGFSQLLAAQASGGGSTTSVIEGSAASINLYQGKTLVVTSGTAIGARRTILANTTTTYTVQAITDFVAGDSFRVVEPAITLAVDGGDNEHNRLVQGQGRLTPTGSLGGVTGEVAGINAIYLVNFKTSSPNFTVIQDAAVCMFGMQLADAVPVFHNATVLAGCNTVSGTTEKLDDIMGIVGLGVTAWNGWGAMVVDGATELRVAQRTTFVGWLVASAVRFADMASGWIVGGAIHGRSYTAASVLTVEGGASVLSAAVITHGTFVGPAVTVLGGSSLTHGGNITNAVNNAAADAILAKGGSLVNVTSGALSTNNAAATKLNASSGSVIAYDNAITEAGTGTFATGSEKATTEAKADFTNDGFAIQGAGGAVAAAGVSGGVVRRGLTT